MTYPDGTASVTLSGPAVELNAFYLRIEAFARAIRNGNISALTDENTAGFEVADQDSIAALMFDIATRATPQMTIAVTTHDTMTGESATKEIALEAGDETDPQLRSLRPRSIAPRRLRSVKPKRPPTPAST